MPLTYPALRAELNTDPRAYGYAPYVPGTQAQALADLLNFDRNGMTPCPVNNIIGPSVSIRRIDIAPQEVLEAIDNRDFITNANTLVVGWFESMTQALTIRMINDDGTDTRVLGNLKRMVNNTNGTQTRITTIANRAGSRAEELFGREAEVSPADIYEALA
ncbi:MAG TPA: hypothetical protein VNM48_00500 [Chloroflexota bacterium]|nr:hypothetical protein [Chloroflexota bacterium]